MGAMSFGGAIALISVVWLGEAGESERQEGVPLWWRIAFYTVLFALSQAFVAAAVAPLVGAISEIVPSNQLGEMSGWFVGKKR